MKVRGAAFSLVLLFLLTSRPCGVLLTASRPLDPDVVQFLASRGLSPPIMDKDQVERMKRHYDAHANVASTPQALQQRQQGRAIQLKRFHNDVKRALIEEFGRNSLLDLGCGRGGDLNKWLDAGIRDVVGVDLSPNEIEEATRRYRELKADLENGKRRARRGGGALTVEFHQSDELGTVSPLRFGREPASLESATCMFALHYFFETEASARHLLTTVSASLRPGGFFFGVLPDGDRVRERLRTEGGGVTNDMFRLRLCAASNPSDVADPPEAEFGCAYEFALSDTVTGQVADSDGSREFMVFERTLTALAAEFGLRPVGPFRSPKLARLLTGTETDALFKHFAPRYTGDDAAALTEASVLNCAFCLRKEGAEVGERSGEREGGNDAGRGGAPGGGERRRDGGSRRDEGRLVRDEGELGGRDRGRGGAWGDRREETRREGRGRDQHGRGGERWNEREGGRERERERWSEREGGSERERWDEREGGRAGEREGGGRRWAREEWGDGRRGGEVRSRGDEWGERRQGGQRRDRGWSEGESLESSHGRRHDDDFKRRKRGDWD